MEKKQFLSPLEGVKVGSSDMFCKLFEKIHNFMVPDCTTQRGAFGFPLEHVEKK